MGKKLAEKAQIFIEKVPERYQPTAMRGAALAGIITVFAGAHAIFGSDDAEPQTQPETIQTTPIYGHPLLGIKSEFFAVSDAESCEAAAEAMRTYGKNINDPQFEGLTIYANCAQTGPDQFSLILQNGPE